MARKSAQAPVREEPLNLVVPREEARKRIIERIDLGIELKERQISDNRTLTDVRHAYWTWNEYNVDMLRQMFTSPKYSKDYSGFGIASGTQRQFWEEVEQLHSDIDSKIRRLESINNRLELIPLSPGVSSPPPSSRQVPVVADLKVFVVYGHDEGVRETVARFISVLDLVPVMLHEHASQGRTIVEKLEHHGDAGYAVVLLTPDDIGGTSVETLMPRARQNVVLELGYFLGRLGRNRVCAIHRGDIELPSDYMGVIYVPFDGSGGWRLLLAKELKAAGFPVDLNKAM